MKTKIISISLRKKYLISVVQKIFCIAFVALIGLLFPNDSSANHRVEQWKVFELGLQDDQFMNEISPDTGFGAIFSNGTTNVEVAGFRDGKNVFKVRFSPHLIGNWTYQVLLNGKRLEDHKGAFECIPPEKDNHGPVQVVNNFSFEYVDGTSFHPFGTTLYAWIHQTDSLRQHTLKTLSEREFNKVRMCIFPKDYWWNHNEPQFYPFTGDPDSGFNWEELNPDFFRNLEEAISSLDSLGIQVDLILFHPYDRWGFSKMNKETNREYVKYIIARLAAYKNVWWSLANEYDFMGSFDISDWNDLLRFLKDNDPYGRLRSIHNGVSLFDYTNPDITHASIQSMNFDSIQSWRDQFQKPIIIDECGYEGNIPWDWGNLSAQMMVHQFWECVSKGAYATHGETFLVGKELDEAIETSDATLWWSKGGDLEGQSPERIEFLKSIVEDGSGSKSDSPDDYLIYLGMRQPAIVPIDLDDTSKFRISIIDTWNMTIEEIDRAFSGHSRIRLPGDPGLALRIKRLVE